MKTALVTGSSGFIGGHLVKDLIRRGYFVIGADIEKPKYNEPLKFYESDLRSFADVDEIFYRHKIDEVYNLACLMGGMGYIGSREHDYDVMVGSSQIVSNINVECVRNGVEKLFYSSSACVYNMHLQEDENVTALKEEDAYCAEPDLTYGWQKLFSEQMTKAIEGKGVQVRIARFHNIFGPYGTYEGGKEKAPAALCRKVAMAKDGDFIEVWGDGKQTRSFLNIHECIEGIERLMNSDYSEPINIGSDELISINDLAKLIIEISGKKLSIKNIPGNVGVRGRNSDNTKIKEVLGWAPAYSLISGIEQTYHWILSEINNK